MESTTRKILRVSKRVLLNRSKKAKNNLVKIAKSEVTANELIIEDGLLSIEGTAKFLHYTNEEKHPITLSLVNSETKETIITTEAEIGSVFGHVLPVKKSNFSATFNLKECNKNGELNGKKFDVILKFEGYVNRSFRLYIPIKKINNGFINEYYKAEQTIYYPYRTAFGNLSIFFLSSEDKEELKTIPNKVTEFNLSHRHLDLAGSVDSAFLQFFNLEPEKLSLVIKRRGSSNLYFTKMDIINEQWKAKVDIKEIDFSKGVWDFYISTEGESPLLYRMKIFNNEIFNDHRTFYIPTEKESYRGIYYRTKQSGLSINIRAVLIQTSSLKIEAVDQEIQFKAAFPKDALNFFEDQTLNSMSLFLRQRDTNQEINFPLEYEEEKLSTRYDTHCSFLYKDILSGFGITKKIWDVYLDVELSNEVIRMRIKTNSDLISQTSKSSYFVDQSLYSMYFYPTIYNRLSLVYTLAPLRRTVTDYRFEKLNLLLKGNAYIDSSEIVHDKNMTINIIARNRVTEEETYFPCDKATTSLLKPLKTKSRAAGIRFKAEVSLVELQALIETPKDIIDFYIEVADRRIVRREKIGLKNYKYFKDDVLTSITLPSKYEDIDVSYCLTITPRGNLKIETFKLEKNFEESLLVSKNEDEIWLIGERPDTAQDTGYHFFRYCRLNHPDQKVFYAINGDSTDLKNIEHLGNVLISGTPEHFEIASQAKVLIGSHDFDYFLPFKGIQSADYKNAVKVFLQHGVLGRKMVEYNKKYYKYPFDIFCVSSTDEKNMVMDQLGYEDRDIKVTGLSRFDQLLADHHPKREILLIPTWREWLNTTEALLDSEYLKRYAGLLQNPELIKLLKRHNLTLNFYPHYRMQQFFDEFGSDFDSSIKLVKLGEKNVQDLLKDNALMITDFSSVSFDFTYLGKPVIFYHFDRDSFFKGGIMRPYDETFLGDIAYDETELINFIEKSIERNFTENDDLKYKKSMIFDYVDQNNCKRIYDEIVKARKKTKSEQ